MQNSLAYAQEKDANDPLKNFRDDFYFPQFNGKNCLYFCGNSLGLQAKSTQEYIQKELDHWKKEGVEGHFKGDMPWMYYHKFFAEQSAKIVGANPQEVVVMNTLTTNLHLLMVSFYRPNQKRYKIIMEGGAFPSDQYAMESQARFHGLDPEQAIIELQPRTGEHSLHTEDILRQIEETGDELALVMIGAVNYYTGQWYDMEAITKAAHKVGAQVGFDMAHAAGNVPVKLHDWQVDFAVWCTYKYLNSGPGGPSGLFVHEKHGNNPSLPRFAGWWGHNEAERFQMKKGFIPMEGAAGWQLSNAQIFAMAPLKASLDIFEKAGINRLRAKSIELSNYLEFLIEDLNRKGHHFNIITPKNSKDRGAQLSILTDEKGKALYDHLTDNGVICDWREPNVIRLAPVPLYNSFEDVFQFVKLLAQ